MIIAEVAQAHEGSLGLAHAYIDAVAAAGVDAVKFQTHIAGAESTRNEPWRVKFSTQDASRYNYWKRMEFTEEQWAGLKEHACARGLMFLSSPFSREAAELLLRIGITTWKIASGEVDNTPLLDFITATKLPVLLSTGMSHVAETDGLVTQFQRGGVPVTVLQCTSAYPCPPDQVGLNMIGFFRERYHTPVGLSDHSGQIYAGLAAATLGIDALEVHVTLSRECFGPDVLVSVTTAELRQLADGVRFIEQMVSHPIEKDEVGAQFSGLRHIFMKSVALRHDLPAGAVLGIDDLILKKPGTGIPPERLPQLLGHRLTRSVAADHLLAEEDVAKVNPPKVLA
jgi:N,N'-diacetyllegionaminate synthase